MGVTGIGEVGDRVGIGSTEGDGVAAGGGGDPPQAPVNKGPTTRMDAMMRRRDRRDQFIVAGRFTMRARLETAESHACDRLRLSTNAARWCISRHVPARAQRFSSPAPRTSYTVLLGFANTRSTMGTNVSIAAHVRFASKAGLSYRSTNRAVRSYEG